MSIICPDCGAVAGRGFELGHRSGCPQLSAAPMPAPPSNSEDRDLLYQAYLGVTVLHGILKNEKLELGALVAREIINAIDMRHPAFAGRAQRQARERKGVEAQER